MNISDMGILRHTVQVRGLVGNSGLGSYLPTPLRILLNPYTQIPMSER